MTTMLDHLKQVAAGQKPGFPQYDGHFDGYVLVQVAKDVRTKMGLAFRKGEYAIAEPEPDEFGRRVYSVSNQCVTAVRAADIRDVPQDVPGPDGLSSGPRMN